MRSPLVVLNDTSDDSREGRNTKQSLNNKCYCDPQPKKKFIYEALIQSIPLCAADTRTLNTKQGNKLLTTGTDFWRRSAR